MHREQIIDLRPQGYLSGEVAVQVGGMLLSNDFCSLLGDDSVEGQILGVPKSRTAKDSGGARSLTAASPAKHARRRK